MDPSTLLARLLKGLTGSGEEKGGRAIRASLSKRREEGRKGTV